MINDCRSRYTCVRCAQSCMFFAADYKRCAQSINHMLCCSYSLNVFHTLCTHLCIHKPDGLIYEVIKTVNVKLAEAAATERTTSHVSFRSSCCSRKS